MLTLSATTETSQKSVNLSSGKRPEKNIWVIMMIDNTIWVIIMMVLVVKLTVCFVQQEISSDEFFEAPILALDKPGKRLEKQLNMDAA